MKLTFRLLLIVAIVFTSTHAQQSVSSSSCPFVGCRCTKNYDQSYDITCVGDDSIATAAARSSDTSSFPLRIEISSNDSSTGPQPIPVINTFLVKKYKFTRIPEDTFTDLTIRNLIIGENQLSVLNLNSFRGIKSLTLLRIIEKNLEHIEPGSLNWISESLNELGLWQLNFKSEHIDKFFSELRTLHKLKVLNIMGYGLTEFKPEWTVLFENLTSLNLGSNDLRAVTVELFKSCSNLIVLDLSNNFLENLTNVYEALRPVQFKLRELKLIGNSIAKLVDFPKFPSLEVLDLSYNKLKLIEDNSFFSLPKLTHLYLTNNVIERIENEAFKYSRNLAIILLNNNQLSRTPIILNMPKLKIIDLVNQDGKLKSVGDFAFERIEAPINSLSIHLDFNDIESFGNRTFCSRYYNVSEIFNLDLSMGALKIMNKCVLRQLTSKMSTRVYLNVALSQQPAERHTEICNCNFKAFANRNKIDLVGACGQLIGKCESMTSKQSLIDDECKDRLEFVCN
jgi:Leucine-rich repeat (LRR) protein